MCLLVDRYGIVCRQANAIQFGGKADSTSGNDEKYARSGAANVLGGRKYLPR